MSANDMLWAQDALDATRSEFSSARLDSSPLPSHWHLVLLGDVCRVQNGFPFKSEYFDSNNGVPLIRVRSLKAQRGDIRFRGDFDESYIVRDGDILIGMDGDFQPCWWKGGEGLLNQRVCRLVAFAPTVDPYYIYQALKQPLQTIEDVTHFTTVKHLSSSTVQEIVLPLPPLPEQRAIAHILRTVQYAIAARRREVELERERKAALMQHLFTHGTRGEPTKQTEIGEMPERWQVVRLGDLCANGRGFIQTGPFGSQLHASDYRDTGIPIVNPTHLGFNTIVETHLPRIATEDADRLSRHYLVVGDILIARRGDFSRYSYIGDAQAGWLCGTGCLLIRLSNPDVDNYFVSVSMSTETIQDYMRQNAVGSIMPNLNTKILVGMPLALPSSAEQHEIANALRACEIKIVALERETEYVEELFRALLEELMTGRLSVLPLVDAKIQMEDVEVLA